MIPEHEHVVKYYGGCVEELPSGDVLYLVTAFAGGGTLSDLLREYGPCDERAARKLTRGIVKGLAHLHKNGIAHRDIKNANILLSESGVPMIADFDVARVRPSTIPAGGGPFVAKTITGTPFWMSPEVIENGDRGYDPFLADVWSLGATVFSMLSTDGNTPFKPMSNVLGVLFSIVQQGSSGKIVALTEDANFLACSDECRDFVSACLSPVGRRPTSEQLLGHPWLLAADVDLHRVDARAAVKGQAAAAAGDAATSSMVMHRPSSLTASSASSIQSSLATTGATTTTTTGSAATQAGDVTQHIDGVTLGDDDFQ